jgi:uncharacterized membrane protein
MKDSEKMAPIAAVISALSNIACCLPVVIASVSGAASLGAIGVLVEPLRPWLIGLSIVGFLQLYRSRDACQRHSRTSVAVFWFSAIMVLAALVFPQALAIVLADL